jgi:membrane-associated phospholipid phosphatase
LFEQFMTTALRWWLAALIACVVAVILSVLFVDRPLALFLHHPYGHPKIELMLRAVPVIVLLGAFAILACGVLALAGRSPPRWLETARLCGFSLMWALVSTVMLLKPAFGRANIEKLFAPPTFYGFHPFHSTMQSAFPSGHAAAVAAVFSVLWIVHPRLRWFCAGIIALVMLGLVLAGWHFLADVIAGLFVGATAGLMTVRQWQEGRR